MNSRYLEGIIGEHMECFVLVGFDMEGEPHIVKRDGDTRDQYAMEGLVREYLDPLSGEWDTEVEVDDEDGDEWKG